jgi:hypothetical protein
MRGAAAHAHQLSTRPSPAQATRARDRGPAAGCVPPRGLPRRPLRRADPEAICRARPSSLLKAVSSVPKKSWNERGMRASIHSPTPCWPDTEQTNGQSEGARVSRMAIHQQRHVSSSWRFPGSVMHMQPARGRQGLTEPGRTRAAQHPQRLPGPGCRRIDCVEARRSDRRQPRTAALSVHKGFHQAAARSGPRLSH